LFFNDDSAMIPSHAFAVHDADEFEQENDIDATADKAIHLAYLNEGSGRTNGNIVQTSLLTNTPGEKLDREHYIGVHEDSYPSLLFPDHNVDEKDHMKRIPIRDWTDQVGKVQRTLLNVRPANFNSISFDHGFHYHKSPTAPITFDLDLNVQPYVPDNGDDAALLPYYNQVELVKQIVPQEQ